MPAGTCFSVARWAVSFNISVRLLMLWLAAAPAFMAAGAGTRPNILFLMGDDTSSPYTRPATRLTGHLTGYDPAQAPTFAWPERLTQAKSEIRRKPEERSEPAEAAAPRPQSAATDASRLSLDRIFLANEFKVEKPALFHWSKRGNGSTSHGPRSTG